MEPDLIIACFFMPIKLFTSSGGNSNLLVEGYSISESELPDLEIEDKGLMSRSDTKRVSVCFETLDVKLILATIDFLS